MAHADRSEPVTLTLTLQDVNDGEELPIRTILLGPHAWSVQIGRGSQTDSRLRPQFDNAWFGSRVMSRDHALITVEPQSRDVVLTDIKSMHGTYIDGTRLEPNDRRVLLEDDVVTFGADILRGELTYHALKLKLRLQWSDEYAQNLQQWVEGLKSPSLIVDETRSSPQRADRAAFSNSYSLDYSDDEGSDEDVRVICETAAGLHKQKKEISDKSSLSSGPSDSNSIVEPQQVDTAPSSPADDRNGGKPTTGSCERDDASVIIIEESLQQQEPTSNMKTLPNEIKRSGDVIYDALHQSTSECNMLTSDCDLSDAEYDDSVSDNESTYLANYEEADIGPAKAFDSKSQNNEELGNENSDRIRYKPDVTQPQIFDKHTSDAIHTYQPWSTIPGDRDEDSTRPELQTSNGWVGEVGPPTAPLMTQDTNKLPPLTEMPLLWNTEDVLDLPDISRSYRCEPRYFGALTMAEYSSFKPPQQWNSDTVVQANAWSTPEQSNNGYSNTDGGRKRKFDQLSQSDGVKLTSILEKPSSPADQRIHHSLVEHVPHAADNLAIKHTIAESNVVSDEQAEVAKSSIASPITCQASTEADLAREERLRKRIKLHKQTTERRGQRGRAFIKYTATALAGVAVGAVGTIFGLAALPADYFL